MNTEDKGKRVRLISMKGETSIPMGTKGTIKFVDGIGQIHVEWDNGSSLALIPGEDKYTILEESKKTIMTFEKFRNNNDKKI